MRGLPLALSVPNPFSALPSISTLDGTADAGDILALNRGVHNGTIGTIVLEFLQPSGSWVVVLEDASVGSYQADTAGSYRLVERVGVTSTYGVSSVLIVASVVAGAMNAPVLSDPTGYTVGTNPPETQVSIDDTVDKTEAVLDLWFDRNSSGAFDYNEARRVTYTDLMGLFFQPEGTIVGRNGLTAGPFREIARWRVPTPKQTIIDGDSRVVGLNLLPAVQAGDRTYLAVGGTDVNDAKERINDYPALRPRRVIMFPTQTMGAAQAYIDAYDDYITFFRQSLGNVPLYLGTSLPADVPSHKANRAAADAQFRTWVTEGKIQGVLDLAADPVIGPDSALTDTNLYADYIHLSPGGNDRLAVIFNQFLSDLDAAAPLVPDRVSPMSTIRQMVLGEEAMTAASTTFDYTRSAQYARNRIQTFPREMEGTWTLGVAAYAVTDTSRTDERYIEFTLLDPQHGGGVEFGIVPMTPEFMPNFGRPTGTVYYGIAVGVAGDVLSIHVVPPTANDPGTISYYNNGNHLYTEGHNISEYRAAIGPSEDSRWRVNAGQEPFTYPLNGVKRWN